MSGMTEEEEKAYETERARGLGILKLVQGSSDAVKENRPEGVRAGDFILQGQIRKRLRLTFCGRRPHATLFKGGQIVQESFQPNTIEYTQIKAAKLNGDGGAKVGVDALAYLRDEDRYVVIPLQNSAESVGDRVREVLKADPDFAEVHELRSEFVKKRNSFWVPTLTRMDRGSPLDPDTTNRAQSQFYAYQRERTVDASAPPV